MPQQMLVGADFPSRDTGIRSKSSIRPHPPADSDLLNGLVTSELRRMFCRECTAKRPPGHPPNHPPGLSDMGWGRIGPRAPVDPKRRQCFACRPPTKPPNDPPACPVWGGVELDPYSSRPEPPSVLRARADCGCTHQLFDGSCVLLARQFCDGLCDRADDFICFLVSDFIPARCRSLRLARKNQSLRLHRPQATVSPTAVS